MSLENLVEVFVPYEVENHIALAGLALVEADVVLDADFVEHVEKSLGTGVWKRTVLSAGVLIAEMAVLGIA